MIHSCSTGFEFLLAILPFCSEFLLCCPHSIGSEFSVWWSCFLQHFYCYLWRAIYPFVAGNTTICPFPFDVFMSINELFEIAEFIFFFFFWLDQQSVNSPYIWCDTNRSIVWTIAVKTQSFPSIAIIRHISCLKTVDVYVIYPQTFYSLFENEISLAFVILMVLIQNAQRLLFL